MKKILLASDGSANAEAALELIYKGPWPQQAMLEVLIVSDKTMVAGHVNMQQAEEIAERAIDKLSSKYGKERVRATVLAGHAVETIADYAGLSQVDLVMVGAHSWHGLLNQLLYGNTVTRLLAERSKLKGLCIARTSQNKSCKRVLVCGASDTAIERVASALCELEWEMGTIFRLEHIFAPSTGSHSANPELAFEMHQQRDEQNRAARTEGLKHAENLLIAKFPQCSTEVEAVRDAVPAERILSICHDWQADMIVLGPPEHIGIDKFLPGSVANLLARQAPCSVLILP